MKVLILTRYARNGASSRMRSLQYIPYLETHGWTVEVAPLFGHDYVANLYAGRSRVRSVLTGYLQRVRTLLRARAFDVLWIEKELFPFLPASAERLLRLARVPVVVDYDDALFHRYDCHRSALVRRLLGRKIDTVMRCASIAVAGNSYLAARAEEAGVSRVEVVPTVVDASRYAVHERAASRLVVIGWIGSPATAKYLAMLAEPLARLQQRLDVRVRLIGSGPVDLPGVECEVVEWTEAAEPERVASLDIGIMPLPDNPWERGKCGYKLIQYMASGLPVVASPVGVNVDIVQPGENGFLATTAGEWEAALSTLATDHALRTKMGRLGRRQVETQYSLQVQAPRLDALLRAACRIDFEHSDNT